MRPDTGACAAAEHSDPDVRIMLICTLAAARINADRMAPNGGIALAGYSLFRSLSVTSDQRATRSPNTRARSFLGGLADERRSRNSGCRWRGKRRFLPAEVGRFSVHVQVTWRILSDLASSSLAVGLTWSCSVQGAVLGGPGCPAGGQHSGSSFSPAVRRPWVPICPRRCPDREGTIGIRECC